MLDIYLHAFVSLFVVINPIALVPVFLSLSQNMTAIERNKAAYKACCIAAIVLLIFAFGGKYFLGVMGISQPAFQIAGGFLLMIAAVEMVIAYHTGMTSTTSHEEKEAKISNDISVFPLAIPLISGPGALTTVVLLMQKTEKTSIFEELILVGIILVVMGITFLFLRASPFLLKILGVTGSNVGTRIFGIILTALATQFIISGIKSSFF